MTVPLQVHELRRLVRDLPHGEHAGAAGHDAVGHIGSGALEVDDAKELAIDDPLTARRLANNACAVCVVCIRDHHQRLAGVVPHVGGRQRSVADIQRVQMLGRGPRGEEEEYQVSHGPSLIPTPGRRHTICRERPVFCRERRLLLYLGPMRSYLMLGLLVVACRPTEQTAAGPSAFSQVADAYFDSSFAFAPSAGTAVGFHQYDTLFEDRSAAAVTRRLGTLRAQLAQLDSVRAGKLSSDDSIDAAIVDGSIRSEVQDLDVLASWRKNPISYVGSPGNAVDLLMKRDFAPPAERLRALTARLRQMPAMFAAMKANMDNPPVEFTDLAIRVAAGSVGFFQHDVAGWAKTAAGADTGTL